MNHLIIVAVLCPFWKYIMYNAADQWPLGTEMSTHSGVIIEVSEREKFCDNFREKKFWSKFWISLYILYIFTSPSAQDREKSVSLGRLFLPDRPLG